MPCLLNKNLPSECDLDIRAAAVGLPEDAAADKQDCARGVHLTIFCAFRRRRRCKQKTSSGFFAFEDADKLLLRRTCTRVRVARRCYCGKIRTDFVTSGDQFTFLLRHCCRKMSCAVNRTKLRRRTYTYSTCSRSNFRWTFPANAKWHLRQL